MKTNFKKHSAKVSKLAKKVTNRVTYGKEMYAIDVNRWGIYEPFSDPENDTIYRLTIKELAIDTFDFDY